jgi:hypothetical protein
MDRELDRAEHLYVDTPYTVSPFVYDVYCSAYFAASSVLGALCGGATGSLRAKEDAEALGGVFDVASEFGGSGWTAGEGAFGGVGLGGVGWGWRVWVGRSGRGRWFEVVVSGRMGIFLG